jgi:hypothetical protein
VFYHEALSGKCVPRAVLFDRDPHRGSGLSTTIKYLRRTTRGAAGSGLGATINLS